MRKLLKIILFPFVSLYRQWTGRHCIDGSGNCRVIIGDNSRSTVSINGEIYSGQTVEMVNGKVYVDNVLQKREKPFIGDISIQVNGDVDSIETGSGNVTAQSVTSISTGSGNVKCHDVMDSVSTMAGNVRCNHVHGNITTMSGKISKNLK